MSKTVLDWRGLLLAAGLLLAGCDGADFEDPSGQNTVAAPAPVPNLTAKVQNDGVQDYVEAFFQAEVGGKLVLPNGAELEIPPGALSQSQTLRFSYNPRDIAPGGPHDLDDYGEDPHTDGDMYYDVTPSQSLSKAAIVRLPYPLDEQWEYPDLVVNSPDVATVESGSEETRYEPLTPDYDEERDLIIFTTTHFTGFDLLTAGEPAYLVMDVPQPYLEPSDILMTLTTREGTGGRIALGPGPGWVPGHVGLYVGPGATFPAGTVLDTGGSSPHTLAGIPDSIEAIPDKVHAVNVDYFRSGFESDHLYLGPRRPRAERTSDHVNRIVGDAPRALQKPYYVLGDSFSFLGSLFNPGDLTRRVVDPFSTDRGYSCVGLVDVLYLYAGISTVGTLDRALIAVTPKDMMQSTDPVRKVRLRAGEPFRMELYGVLRKPKFSAVLSRVPYTRERRHDNDGVVNSYDLRVEGLPPEARLREQGNNGYLLEWTPRAPGVFKSIVKLEAEVFEKVIPIPFVRSNKRLERGKNDPLIETLEFEVVP